MRGFPPVVAVCLSPFLLVFFTLYFATSSFGQNLIPNGQFESYSVCPNGLNQTIYLDDWTLANATADYFNCSFYGSGTVQGVPASGTGLLGVWGGSNHPACTGTGYAESIMGHLNSSMVSGESYVVSFSAQVDATGTASSGSNGCMDLGFYFFNSSNPPPTGQICCASVVPQVRVSGASLQAGVYTSFSTIFTSSDAFDQVMIGSFCNGLSASASCANYANNRMYFNLDDISVEVASVLPISSLPPEKEALAVPLLEILSPNPVQKQIDIALSPVYEARFQLRLSDLSGRILKHIDRISPAGSKHSSVEVGSLSPGLYVLEMILFQPGRSPYVLVEKIQVAR